jgi:acetyl/propionyl-CoA carboxylase alpha subunit
MISKLCCHAATRERAIARMRRAVAEYRVVGIRTTLPFLEWALRSPAFTSGDYDTSFVDRHWEQRSSGDSAELELAVATAALEEYRNRRARRLEPPAAGGGSAWWRAGTAERLGRGL